MTRSGNRIHMSDKMGEETVSLATPNNNSLKLTEKADKQVAVASLLNPRTATSSCTHQKAACISNLFLLERYGRLKLPVGYGKAGNTYIPFCPFEAIERLFSIKRLGNLL